VLLYTLAAWIAASRVLIGQHYVTDVVLGAILGTVFPYFVRDRFAARRWLFERTPEGGYRIRGIRTQRWLGWPGSERLGSETGRLFGHSAGNSRETPPD
jgi:undecaprenyl-diphosphatase